MKKLGSRLLNEPALVFTGITTAYAAAIAAGWEPVQGVAIGVAAAFAFFGIVLRQNVSGPEATAKLKALEAQEN